MAGKEYKFNPQTLTYEVIQAPFKIRTYRLLRKIIIGFILASLVNFAFSFFVYTPKMYRIARANNELLLKYDVLADKISASQRKILEIKNRDQNVYRPLFAIDTLNVHGIYISYPDEKYIAMEGDKYAPLMIGTWKSLDALTRLIYLESVSLDEIQMLSKDKEQMAASIPAIWPIDRTFLRGNIGRYGMRNHPISGRYQMHHGIDLSANTGTPVYATGNARVVSGRNNGLYGLQILLDHGFGYQTSYSHLSRILVVPGQEVKRGDMIGHVGDTGYSKGSHLHYEVIYRGKDVDPMNYFRGDMTAEEFEQIVQNAIDTIYE